MPQRPGGVLIAREEIAARVTEREFYHLAAPILRITGGTYTGVAATWARQTLPDVVAMIGTYDIVFGEIDR